MCSDQSHSLSSLYSNRFCHYPGATTRHASSNNIGDGGDIETPCGGIHRRHHVDCRVLEGVREHQICLWGGTQAICRLCCWRKKLYKTVFTVQHVHLN